MTEVTNDNVEKFLLICICNKNVGKFNDLRYKLYHKKLHQFNLEKFPPTSSSVRKHVIRVYLQCHLWLHAPVLEDKSTDPLEYGCMFNDEDHLAPIMNPQLALLPDFPSPCNCLKCAQAQICPNRLKLPDLQV